MYKDFKQTPESGTESRALFRFKREYAPLVVEVPNGKYYLKPHLEDLKPVLANEVTPLLWRVRNQEDVVPQLREFYTTSHKRIHKNYPDYFTCQQVDRILSELFDLWVAAFKQQYGVVMNTFWLNSPDKVYCYCHYGLLIGKSLQEGWNSTEVVFKLGEELYARHTQHKGGQVKFSWNEFICYAQEIVDYYQITHPELSDEDFRFRNDLKIKFEDYLKGLLRG